MTFTIICVLTYTACCYNTNDTGMHSSTVLHTVNGTRERVRYLLVHLFHVGTLCHLQIPKLHTNLYSLNTTTLSYIF